MNHKIATAKVDIIEFEVPRVSVNDARGGMGGKLVAGVLRLITDTGIEGNAHIGDRGGGGAATIQSFKSTFDGRLAGMNIADREWLWHQLPRMTGHGASVYALWSHVDVALWDAAGKAAGMPVHEMLGTARRTTEVYATYPPRNSTIAGYVAEAAELAEQGFSAYKIHPGAMPTDEVIKMVGAVRREVGDEMRLMLDPNNGYDLRAALKIGRALDENGFYWFEDPVPWDDWRAIRTLSEELDTPLNMSDSGQFLLHEAARVLEQGWPTTIRGTTRKIGITGLKKQCGMAEAFNVNCEVGTAGNSLMNAANLNVIMSVLNCDFYEYWSPLEAQQFGLKNEILVNSDGVLTAPTAPGLGFSVDEDFVTRHLVSTIEL